ncbi:EF-hand protein [Laetiporus sulphureus 93-53]|uniref:EF-hand protein n=1 Tax=Laetiporus sulphureus 93-53 TaxID=1314785 RepID=A0A165F7P9_9APHY|nr:EF-hand protein [Laetiporus sulphureus 93-53]KZT08551.1 EF-hand protein [Laetiporus sulphureus 93-53]
MSNYGGLLSPTGGSNDQPNKPQRPRQRREPSGVFSLFSPSQIQQFREAFSLIDHDGNGVVSEQDLKHIFASLGVTPSKKMMDDLLADRPGEHKGNGVHSRLPSVEVDVTNDRGITFPMFLTMMGEHLCDFDSEAELLEAFECFDENDSGIIKSDELRRWLGDVGERMDQKEIDKLLKGPFTDRQGNFNYREWVKVLRINADSDEADSPQ